jgi:hypothetical protein
VGIAAALGLRAFQRRNSLALVLRLARMPKIPFGGVLLLAQRNSHDEVVARVINLIIGRAAYETAVQLYPGERVDYRHGAHIIASSGPESKEER